MAKDQSMSRTASLCQEITVPKTIPVCIQDVFYRRVLEQHDAPAVCAWDGELTYGELDDKSSSLARILAQKGIHRGSFVPLCFDRSLWTAVAMLAVLKAGGVFCFLEPKYPLARLEHMCRHINAKMVLSGESRSELARKLGEHLAVNEDLLATSPSDQEMVDVAPNQAAYVAFTSGSTGKPKGILVSHQALVAGILYNDKPMYLNRTSRVLSFASFAFDVSFLEHFWALLVGGCMCIPSESDRENNLLEAIENLQVNWAFLTPSVARVLNPTKLPSLRHLIMGGEPITQTDIDMWSPHVHLIGVYGPAECAGCTTIQSDYGKVESAANIGFPYAVTCWIVDENNHNVLVPTGSIGELVVQGPSLSEGYVNDPEQSAKSYITNPLWLSGSKEAEQHLYKTGDLVRRLSDGSLHFISRKDTQVKINGQRIELGEVEHHTRAVLGGNREVIVEAVKAGRPSSSLVAFIVTDNIPQSSTELFLAPDAGFKDRINTTKSLLRERLPDYMVPETYISINHLPSTVTGKADRKRLREQFTLLTRAQIKAYFGLEDKVKVMPLTETELKMQRLWAKVLNLDLHEIARDDDWVSLGGDSLGAMQLASLARSEQFFLAVPEIFRHKTISMLCQNIKTDVTETIEEMKPFALLCDHELESDRILQTIADQCQVSQNSIEDAYPITSLQLDASIIPIQWGLNYTLRLEFKLPPTVDPAQLTLAWEMTVASNPVLRTRIVELTKDHYIQAVIRSKIPLENLDSSNMARYEPAVDVWGIGKPLVRVGLQANRFVMLIHHAIYDGQSLPLVFRDISNAYQGQKLALIHFAPFVRWSKSLDAPKRQFWIDKFAGFDGRVFPPVLDPSLDPVESRELTGHLNIVHDAFTATNKIRVTLAIVISWHHGTNDVVFGGVFARRSAPIPDIIDSAVPTTAMLPDRIKLDPDETPRYNLERDQDNILSLMLHEGIDDRDIEQLSPECEAVACKYGTLLAVQPDLATAYPEMFRERDMQYYGPICALNALMQCYLSPESATISLRLSESTMDGVYHWGRFLDEFEAVFHFIQKNPDVKLCDLRRQLDIPNPRSPA